MKSPAPVIQQAAECHAGVEQYPSPSGGAVGRDAAQIFQENCEPHQTK